MDKLRSSVSLSSYAQKNPIQIYIQKGHDSFLELRRQISHNVARILLMDRFGVISQSEQVVHPLNIQNNNEENSNISKETTTPEAVIHPLNILASSPTIKKKSKPTSKRYIIQKSPINGR
jgi:preprotein translocase subunit SecA